MASHGWLAAKLLLFLLCLAPFAGLVTSAMNGQLGPDPAQTLTLASGIWALRLLLITMSVSPVAATWGRLRFVLRWRRMLGLFAFFYAGLHLLVFLAFRLGWRFGELWSEVVERPYITVGAGALLLLIPLALTSTDTMVRRLGRRWKRLHQLVYPAAVLAMLHFLWQLRSDFGRMLLHALWLLVLLGWRLWRARAVRYRRAGGGRSGS